MSTADTAPLLHLGLHKTASTWLQHSVLVESMGYHQPDDAEVRRLFVFPDYGTFDPDEAAAFVEDESTKAAARGLRLGISAERLSGNPHSGCFDRRLIAERTAQVIPDARVAVVVREQRSMIRSTWQQYIKVGGTRTLKRYLNQVRDPRVPVFNPESFCYDRMVEHYRDTFGAEAVHVALYEDLRDDPLRFLDHLGIEVPASPDAGSRNDAQRPLATAMQRRMNILVPKATSLSPGTGSTTGVPYLARAAVKTANLLPRKLHDAGLSRWNQEIESYVQGRYGTSNLRLAELLNRDLASCGYAMP